MPSLGPTGTSLTVARVVRSNMNTESSRPGMVGRVVASGMRLAWLVLACLLVSGPPVAAQSESRSSRTLPLVISASHRAQQGFVRIINHSNRAGTVRIHAIDDAGQRFGPMSLELRAKASAHFTSADLEAGDPVKGLSSGGVGDGEGDWRLELSTTLHIEPLAYIRTPDGFVTVTHDVVEESASLRHHVPIFNPGSNRSAVSRLRLVNTADTSAEVVIEGLDDRGRSSAGKVRLTLPAGGARTVSAQALESGGEGLSGRLGDGAGKWRLFVSANRPILSMSLVSSSTGLLTNLSTSNSRPDLTRWTHTLPLVTSASNLVQQGFVRVINHSNLAGTVELLAIDDSGRRFGPISLDLGAKASAHFTSADLESGNRAKGLSGGVGVGVGDWRLELSTTLDIEPLAYLRGRDAAFLTSMHDVVVNGAARHHHVPYRFHVPMFNPGSHRSRVSLLRLINLSDTEAAITINGHDDRGVASKTVSLTLPPQSARLLSAQSLESGDTGLSGRLGDGTGKWRLTVSANNSIVVMNLLRSPTGHLANLSTVPTLMTAGGYNGITPSFHQKQDGITTASMADYFRVFLGGMKDSKSQWRPPGFARFPSPPIIRLMGGGTNKQRALLHHAVGLINRDLPQHLHLRIGSDAPHIGHVADTHGSANTESIPNGQMFVYFSDSQSAGYPDGVEGGGFANTRFTHDRSQNPWVKQSLEASFVWVNDGTMHEQQRLGILLHEMLHALGFYAHLYSDEFPSSILGPSGPKGGFHQQWGSQLPEIDGAALRAAHRLPNGITPDQFDVLSFGNWETTYTKIFGSISTNDSQPLQFGVNLT